MRIISVNFCFALALGCGNEDQSVVDPEFRDRTSRAGSSSQTTTGDARPGDEPRASTPPSTCGAAPSEACPPPPTGPNAASNAGTLPPDEGDGGSGGAPVSAGGSGPDASTAEGGAPAGSGGKPGSGGTGTMNGGAGGQDGAGKGGTGKGGDTGQGGAGQGGAGQGGAPPDEPLPDLILDGAYLMSTIRQDYVDASADVCLFNEGCVTGDGIRRVVRFGTRSANVGDADVIVGEPVAGNPLWEFDACHQHFHFEGYARYDLVDAVTGVVLPIGNKNGFCLQDLDSWSNPSCSTYDCTFQGISAGCADAYTPDLDCQWIDITGVAPGTYELVVTVNTDNLIRELRTDNNSTSVTIEIAPTTVRMIP